MSDILAVYKAVADFSSLNKASAQQIIQLKALEDQGKKTQAALKGIGNVRLGGGASSNPAVIASQVAKAQQAQAQATANAAAAASRAQTAQNQAAASASRMAGAAAQAQRQQQLLANTQAKTASTAKSLATATGSASSKMGEATQAARGLALGVGESDRNFTSIIARLATFRGGVAAVTAVVAALSVAAGAMGIKFLAAQEQQEIAFTSLLKNSDAAKKLTEQIQGVAAVTPFQTQDLATRVRQLLAYGFSLQDILSGSGKEAKGLIIDIGNYVAALGGGEAQLEQISRAFGQINAKGKLTGEELRQIAESGLPVYEILNTKLGLTREQLGRIGDQGIAANVAIQALREGIQERFGDAMAAQAETATGRLSTLIDVIQFLSGKAFKALFVAIGSSLQALNEFLTALNNRAGEIGFVAALQEALPGLAPLIKGISDSFKGIGQVLSSIRPLAAAFIKTFAALATTGIGVALQAFGQGLTLISNVIGTIPAPLLKLVGVALAFRLAFGGIAAVFGIISNLIGPLVSGLANVVTVNGGVAASAESAALSVRGLGAAMSATNIVLLAATAALLAFTFISNQNAEAERKAAKAAEEHKAAVDALQQSIEGAEGSGAGLKGVLDELNKSGEEVRVSLPDFVLRDQKQGAGKDFSFITPEVMKQLQEGSQEVYSFNKALTQSGLTIEQFQKLLGEGGVALESYLTTLAQTKDENGNWIDSNVKAADALRTFAGRLQEAAGQRLDIIGATDEHSRSVVQEELAMKGAGGEARSLTQVLSAVEKRLGLVKNQTDKTKVAILGLKEAFTDIAKANQAALDPSKAFDVVNKRADDAAKDSAKAATDALKKRHKAEKENLDDQEKALKNSQKAAEDFYSAVIAGIDKEIDRLEKEYDARLDLLKLAQKQLEQDPYGRGSRIQKNQLDNQIDDLQNQKQAAKDALEERKKGVQEELNLLKQKHEAELQFFADIKEAVDDRQDAETEYLSGQQAAMDAAKEAWTSYGNHVGNVLKSLVPQLKNQLETQKQWAVNLNRIAAKYGPKVALEFQKMGIESAGVVAEVVKNSDGLGDQYVTLLKEMAIRGGDDFAKAQEIGWIIAKNKGKKGAKETSKEIQAELGIGLKDQILLTAKYGSSQDKAWSAAAFSAALGSSKTAQVGVDNLRTGILGIAKLLGPYGQYLTDWINMVFKGLSDRNVGAAGGAAGAQAGFTVPKIEIGFGNLSFAQGGTLNQATRKVGKGSGSYHQVRAFEGETGSEYFIPTHSSKRERSTRLWAQAGKELGVFADGGIVDPQSWRGFFPQGAPFKGFYRTADATADTGFNAVSQFARLMRGLVNTTDAPGVNPNQHNNKPGAYSSAMLESRDYIQKLFGPLSVGGYSNRNVAGTNKLSDHALYRAFDFMVYKDRGKGDKISQFVLDNWKKFQVKYMIWFDRINSGTGWRPYKHPGGGNSPTLRHEDHVHVSYFKDGGKLGGGDLNMASYDSGGILKPGFTLAHNGTGHDEYVSTSNGGVSVKTENNFHGIATTDELIKKVNEVADRRDRELADAIRSRRRQ